MSLSTKQQRKLEQIETEFASSDPRLTSLFVIFARLTRGEAMPWVEAIRARPLLARLAWWRGHRRGARGRRFAGWPAARVRSWLLVPTALATMACAVTLAVVSPGGHRGTPGARPPAPRELVVKTPRPCRFAMPRVPAFAC